MNCINQLCAKFPTFSVVPLLPAVVLLSPHPYGVVGLHHVLLQVLLVLVRVQVQAGGDGGLVLGLAGTGVGVGPEGKTFGN